MMNEEEINRIGDEMMDLAKEVCDVIPTDPDYIDEPDDEDEEYWSGDEDDDYDDLIDDEGDDDGEDW